MANTSTKKWWKNAVVYQIFPRTFCDSNGDGIGDIPGIISKLHYLKELGADVLWLSPVYPCPTDNIFDFKGINPDYGTMEDMERLISRAKRLGIKIIMDFAANSDSEKSCNVDKNYLYFFGKNQIGMISSGDEETSEKLDVLSFWQGKGISGFCCTKKLFNDDNLEIECISFPTRLVTEKKGLFKLFDKPTKPWNLILSIDSLQDSYEFPVNYFDDYNKIRSLNSGANTGPYWEKSEKLFCGLHLSLKGIPFIYEGEETGSCDDQEDNNILYFYKDMIDFRKKSKGLSEGSYRRVASPKDVYIFTREAPEERLYVYCNLTSLAKGVEFYGDKIIFGNYREEEREANLLKPYEFRIVASNI